LNPITSVSTPARQQKTVSIRSTNEGITPRKKNRNYAEIKTKTYANMVVPARNTGKRKAMLCKEGHRIDETNESYGGVICGGCGETFGSESDLAIDWLVDDYDPILDALADLCSMAPSIRKP
jgi:hypothetical protein